MKKLIYVMVAFLMFGCSTDNILKTEQTLERGKGKKERVALLTLPQGSISSMAVTNVMRDPIEYTGELPATDNGGFVDWDNDGQVDDLIVLEQRCYFPRTFTDVVCYYNGTDRQVINNSIAFGAVLLGFDDVDNDGDQDIIFEGGNHYLYNQGETYSQYNVGLNELAEEPTPLADLVSSLTLTSSVANPDFVRWDLGGQYEGYVFHVVWFEVDVNGNVISPYYQTHTYGEWGIYAPNTLLPNANYIIRFTNLGEDCSDVDINFSL